MSKFRIKEKTAIVGITLLFLGFQLPSISEVLWFNMVVDVRKAIVNGDSGHLVLTAAIWSIVSMLQGVFLLLGTTIFLDNLVEKISMKLGKVLFQGFSYIIINLVIQEYVFFEIELLTNILAGITTLFLINYVVKEKGYYGRNFVLSLQVFFAFQWLNIMPMLTFYNFGVTDLAGSIKIVSEYLGSTSVLNFIGLAFFISLLFSTLITTFLFLTNDRNIAIAKENYEKQLTLDAMHAKIVQTRVYEEIHTITHDLKTPLVTIRGLNSLLALSKEPEKIMEYIERVDNAAEKMSEMISGFLYEKKRRIVSTEEIIDYVRAQIPLEDESQKISFDFHDHLPLLYINKVRVSRAIINVIENAILVQTIKPIKKIHVRVYDNNGYLLIEIEDNGIGISKSQMEKIWEVGYSTKATTGLGLAFVKKVIEDNNGTVSMNSKENEGTLVRITLPNETMVDQEE